MGVPLTVALRGFDPRELAALNLFLGRNLPHGCQLVESQAGLLVVNLDAVDGPALWARETRQGQLPSIVLSVREQNLPNGRWLRKPFRLPALVGMIERLSSHRPADESSPLAETDIRRWYSGPADWVYQNAGQQSEVFYRPQDYFLGTFINTLAQVKASGNAVRIDCEAVQMVVRGDAESVFTDSTGLRFRKLGFLHANAGVSIKIHPWRGNYIDWSAVRDPRVHSADDLLWRLALWTSRGRVPVGTDPQAPVALLGWPNFTRMARTPQAMRVVAGWRASPMSLMETARRMDLPFHVVFSVYSGCQVLGLVAHDGSRPKPLPKAEGGSLPSRLFDSLMGRLRKFSGAA